jgi:predicted regulator of Ras-like GTPase activity (Roadblock/LC7/MglB family)|tara:strand:- start:254 stop:544 length:291 start_codon:yes stop_codon:yes gene_type:complete
VVLSDVKVGSCVYSHTNLTGYGIIVEIKKNSEEYSHILGEHQYVILTDFGNIVRLTLDELENNYTHIRYDNIRERFLRQKELLHEAEEYLKDLNML